MDFTTSLDDSKAYLSTPYIGEARLKSITFEPISDIPTITWNYILEGNEEIGQNVEFSHRELKPREDTSVKTLGNLVSRIGYIMKHYIGDEAANKMIDPSNYKDAKDNEEVWEIIVAKVKRYVEDQARSAKMYQKSVVVKILPNRIEKDGRLTGYIFGFPKYKNFMKSLEKKDELVFEAQEKINIAEYNKYVANRSKVAETNDSFNNTTSSVEDEEEDGW